MGEQEKKEFLGRYRLLEQEIERGLREMGRWRRMAEELSTTHPAEQQRELPDGVERMVALRKELNREVCALVALKEEISRSIDGVEDGTLRLLLQYRYIDGSTFEEIAERMHYSWRWVLKLHRQALQRLEIAHGCS